MPFLNDPSDRPAHQDSGYPAQHTTVAAINYDYINGLGDRGKMTGEWLAHCQACSTPEFACVFNRAGIKYDILTGYLEEPYVWNENRKLDRCGKGRTRDA